MSLHELITLVHAYHPTPATYALVSFSEKSRNYDKNEIGDINRLRFIAFSLQTKTGCEKIVIPCVHCSKSENAHRGAICQKAGCSGVLHEKKSAGASCVLCLKTIPMSGSVTSVCSVCTTCSWVYCTDCSQTAQGCTTYVASLIPSALCCSCFKNAAAHPWEKYAASECRCGSSGECLLALCKTFLCHGLAERLSQILLSTLSLQLQCICLHVLWLLSIPEAGFVRCWGGILVQGFVESFTVVRVGLKQETEFLFTVSTNSTPTKREVRKKLPAVTAFQETLAELLKDVLELPGSPRLKGKLDTSPEIIRNHLNDLFRTLGLFSNFQKLLRADSRVFLDFFDVDPTPFQLTRSLFASCFSKFLQPFQKARNFPISVVQFLFNLMKAEPISPPELITDLPHLFPLETSISITRIHDSWLLNLVMMSIPLMSHDIALLTLRKLYDFSTQHFPLQIIAEDKFAVWFFPVLFDRYAGQGEDDSKNEEDQRPVECFNLCVDILCGLHVNHILAKPSPDFKPEQLPKADYALASTISTIGSENGTRIHMWSKKHTEIAIAVIDGVIKKLLASASLFVDRKSHPGQLNTLAILNIYRNLTWCPLFEEAGSSEASQALFMNHLLSNNNNNPSIGTVKAIPLLSENSLNLVRSLLSQLNFIDFDLVSETEEFVNKVKGSGIALTCYFRDCSSCFQIPLPAEQQKMIGLVYGAYRFDPNYSKEEEERLRLILELETPKENMLVGVSDTHVRDLEVLSAGMIVWDVSLGKKALELCYMSLKRQEETMVERHSLVIEPWGEAKEPKLSFTLFEQVTMESSIDVKVLAKHGLDYVQRTGLTLWNKTRPSHYLCISVPDFEHWARALRVLQEKHLFKVPGTIGVGGTLPPSIPRALSVMSAAKVEDGGNDDAILDSTSSATSLHRLLNVVNYFLPTSFARAMWEYSEKVQVATKDVSAELGDVNRLRFLIHAIEAKSGCDQFYSPCEKCGKVEKAHPWQKNSCYKPPCPGSVDLLPSTEPCVLCGAEIAGLAATCKVCDASVCGRCQLGCLAHIPPAEQPGCSACGEPAIPHPWERRLIRECKCQRGEECLLFFFKTFIAHGAVQCLQRMLSNNKSQVQVPLHQHCLHLLWLLSGIPESAFVECFGGTFARVLVVSAKENKSTKKHETEFTLYVECNLSQTKLRKGLSSVVSFQETMIELLTGVVPPDKGRNVEPNAAKTSLVALFEMLSVPENFHKMFHIPKARALFLRFLKIDSTSIQVTKTLVTQTFTELVQRHRARRSFPNTLLHFLVKLMTGEYATPSITIVSDQLLLLKQEEGQEFSIQTVQECWLLSLVLMAIPACSDRLAIEVLRELNHAFIVRKDLCHEILLIVGYQSWFFPLLFDQYAKEDTSASRSVEFFNLSLHMLCMFHGFYILDQPRPEHTEVLKAILRDEVLSAWAGESLIPKAEVLDEMCAEKMVVDTVIMVGGYAGSENGVTLVPWSKTNIEVLLAVLTGTIGKLMASVVSFRNNLEHPAWTNIFEVLNVYRNLAWCPLGDKQQMSQHLLSPSAPHRTKGNAVMLLSEHMVKMICNFLQQLKLFNLELRPDAQAEAEETNRVRTIKGSGLAYLAYFRDCAACFHTTRDHSAEGQMKVLAQFYSGYKFDSSYSKEVDDRLTIIDATEARRRQSFSKTQQKQSGDEVEEKRRHVRDLETLAAGVTVWQVRAKGNKAKQCYLYLKSEEALEKNQEGSGTPKSPLPSFERLPTAKDKEQKETPKPPPPPALDKYVLILVSNGRKQVLSYFNQATLELSCDTKLLAKHGLDYAQHITFTLWKNKKPNSYLACTSMNDFDAWTRVLHVLQQKRITAFVPLSLGISDDAQGQSLVGAKETATDLHMHKLIEAVHRFCPTAFGRAMFEHSEKIQAATSDPSLGALNRLRYLIHTLETKTGCERFFSPCENCGKVEKHHPWQKTNCYKAPCAGVLEFGSSDGTCVLCSASLSNSVAICKVCNSKVCSKCQRGCAAHIAPANQENCIVCEKPAGMHPWQQSIVSECRCGLGECLLFSFKTFLAHSALENLQRMLLASSPLQQALQQHCLHVLWLLSTIPEASFLRCWGGTLAKITVDVLAAAHGELKPDTEILLVVECNSVQTKVKRKLSAIMGFLEAFKEIFSGIVDFPLVKTVDVGVFKAGLSAVLDVVTAPEAYLKMFRSSKARNLFSEFFEIDSKHLFITKAILTQCVAGFVQHHRAERNLPSSVFHFFVKLMVGEPIATSTDIIVDPAFFAESDTFTPPLTPRPTPPLTPVTPQFSPFTPPLAPRLPPPAHNLPSPASPLVSSSNSSGSTRMMSLHRTSHTPATSSVVLSSFSSCSNNRPVSSSISSLGRTTSATTASTSSSSSPSLRPSSPSISRSTATTNAMPTASSRTVLLSSTATLVKSGNGSSNKMSSLPAVIEMKADSVKSLLRNMEQAMESRPPPPPPLPPKPLSRASVAEPPSPPIRQLTPGHQSGKESRSGLQAFLGLVSRSDSRLDLTKSSGVESKLEYGGRHSSSSSEVKSPSEHRTRHTQHRTDTSSQAVASLPKIQESWILSLILLSISASPLALSVVFLRQLSEFFSANPQVRSKIVNEDSFQFWFFPILFELDEEELTLEETGADRSLVTELAVDIFSSAVAHHLLSHVRTPGKQELTAEGLLANTVAHLMSYGKYDVPWSKRNVDAVQAVCNGILGKVLASISTFRNKRSVFFRSAWGNIFEFLHVYRNMTWCPVPTNMRLGAGSTVKYLLETSQRKIVPTDKAVVLLSEHMVAAILEMLLQLKLFDLDSVHEGSIVRTLKGTGLAFLSYFRACGTCLRNSRKMSSDEHRKVLGIFFSTFEFDTAYSKESEERLKAMTEMKKQEKSDSAVTNNSEETNRLTHDLEGLSGGMAVWRVPVKSAVQQCYLYLKRHHAEFKTDFREDQRTPRYLVVFERKGKKTFLPLFEGANVLIGIDPQRLAKHGLEYAQHLGLTLTAGKKSWHFVCTSLEDFDLWRRVIPVLREQWNSNGVKSSGEILMVRNSESSVLRTTSEISALKTTTELTLEMSPLSSIEEAHSDLHLLITAMRQFYSTSLNTAMHDHSEKQLVVRVELGDLSRLRFINRAFQAKMCCQQFSLPCQNCGKAGSIHPWRKTSCYTSGCSALLREIEGSEYAKKGLKCMACNSVLSNSGRGAHMACAECSCRVCIECVSDHGCRSYVPSTGTGVCACGKLAVSHPWEQFPIHCRCGSEDTCVLFAMKTFMAHGGVSWIRRTLLSSSALLKLECLRLLIFLSTIPTASFAQCRGASLVHAVVESYGSVRTGLKQETEFILVVNANLVQTKVSRKLSAVNVFLESLGELLTGIVDLPELQKTKGKTVEVAEVVKSSLNHVLTILSTPDNFHKMFRIEKARKLFMDFLEIDFGCFQVTREVVFDCFGEFVASYRKQRTLPSSVAHLLAQLLAGLGDPDAVPLQTSEHEFLFLDLQQPWILCLSLAAVPCLSDALAVAYISALSDFFESQPLARLKIVQEDNFQNWFLPVLFDPENAEHGRDLVIQHATNILATIHLQHVFSCPRSSSFSLLLKQSSSSSSSSVVGDVSSSSLSVTPVSSSPESLFATTIGILCAWHSKHVMAWSKQNIDIMQSLCISFLINFLNAIPSFRTKTSIYYHTAWKNIFECLNVFRNLSWCPEFAGSVSTEATLKLFLSHLLNSSSSASSVASSSRVLVNEPCFVFLTERMVSTLLTICTNLQIFEYEGDKDKDFCTVTAYNNNRNVVRGYGIALYSYFRDCFCCFRNGGKLELVLAHFYGSYVFDPCFYQEEEERLRMLDEKDARRRNSMLKPQSILKNIQEAYEVEQLKQHVRDLEHVAAGVLVWQIPSKRATKVQMCYLSIVVRESESGASKRSLFNRTLKNTETKSSSSSSSSESSYSVVLEIQRKKSFFKIPDHASLEIGQANAEDMKQLALNSLEFGQHLRLCLTANKKRIDLICLSPDDFECCERVLSVLLEQQTGVNSISSPLVASLTRERKFHEPLSQETRSRKTAEMLGVPARPPPPKTTPS